MSLWGLTKSGNSDSFVWKTTLAPLPGVRVSSIPGRTCALPRGQLVADDTRVGDDFTQPQLQVDLALKGTRIEGHGEQPRKVERCRVSVRKWW